MEGIMEKIPLVSDKIDIIEIYSVGAKIHNVINQCRQNCKCSQYLREIKSLLDTINTNEISEDQKSIFEEISLKNSNSFLLYDQINKKFGSEIFIMNENILKTAVNFEVQKIKQYLKAIDTAEKLEGYIYIFSKSFILFFFRKKKPKKMVLNMSTAEVNAKVAEIYRTLTRMQELADKVMYHPYLDNVIKGVFLDWYELKLDVLKNELCSYTDETISNEAEIVLND